MTVANEKKPAATTTTTTTAIRASTADRERAKHRAQASKQASERVKEEERKNQCLIYVLSVFTSVHLTVLLLRIRRCA